jgi:DNA-binding transcriptional MocR family regulator
MAAFAMARRMGDLKASDVREMLKVTERPEVISFAGGLPAPELFPARELAEIARELLLECGPQALQYSATEGYRPLRRWIARRMTDAWGAPVSEDGVLVTTGSQQALDLTAKLFLDAGDVVLCESPTYLTAISAFRAFAPRFVEVATDAQGIVPEALEGILARERPKFIYVVPNSQNPSGVTWSLERRRRFMDVVARHPVPVIEDSAYVELQFSGELPLPLKALDAAGCVVTLGTFSKVLSPGLRLGWIAAPAGLHEKYVILKQSADLHTPSLTQMLAARWLERADFEASRTRIRETYRVRCEAMVRALEEEMPEGVRFNRPQGGMFVWAELPAGVDARQLLKRCVERDVVFVPGEAFFPATPRRNTLRLNFTNMPPERICDGVRRVAAALRELLAEVPVRVA